MKYLHLPLSCVLAGAVLTLIVLAMLRPQQQPAEPAATPSADAVISNIMTRTSIRQFTSETLSAEETETLLKAGMAAPSACNLQPWRYVVVTEDSLRQQIAGAIHPAAPAAKAPTVIVVCGDMEALFEPGPEYWIEDCSAVCENILLAAHALGLGGVWMGVYPQMERCELLRELLQLPATIQPLGMLAIGHPAESPAPKDKWKPENVHYNKW